MTVEIAPVLHKARTVNWRPKPIVVAGPRSIAGVTARARIDGGAALWSAEFVDVPLRSRNDFAQWSAIEALLDGGVQPVVVRACDPKLVPWPLYQGQPVTSLDVVPHSDGAFFSDETGYAGSIIVARLFAAAAAGATTVQIRVVRAGEFRGGERFAINHPTFGWRMYVIRTITNVAADVLTVTIRAPLWEAAAAGTELEFDAPRCTMVLDGPDAISRDTELRRFGTGAASFIEYAGVP